MIDEHLNNPVYLEEKARELIKEASAFAHTVPMSVYVEKMQKAIFFAAAARCVRELLVVNNG